MILCASFILPFIFIDEGTYNVHYSWSRTKYCIKVHIKLEPGFSRSEQKGFKIEVSKGAKVETDADEHGLVNHTNVLIEFEDSKMLSDKIDRFEFLEQMHIPLKIACQQVLNRLGQIVRVTTNNFWIKSINLRDIIDYSTL